MGTKKNRSKSGLFGIVEPDKRLQLSGGAGLASAATLAATKFAESEAGKKMVQMATNTATKVVANSMSAKGPAKADESEADKAKELEAKAEADKSESYRITKEITSILVKVKSPLTEINRTELSDTLSLLLNLVMDRLRPNPSMVINVEDINNKIDALIKKEKERFEKEKGAQSPATPEDQLVTNILNTLKTSEYKDPANRYVVKKAGKGFTIDSLQN